MRDSPTCRRFGRSTSRSQKARQLAENARAAAAGETVSGADAYRVLLPVGFPMGDTAALPQSVRDAVEALNRALAQRAA